MFPTSITNLLRMEDMPQMLADSGLFLIVLSPAVAQRVFHIPWVICCEGETLMGRELCVWRFTLSESACCFSRNISHSDPLK